MMLHLRPYSAGVCLTASHSWLLMSQMIGVCLRLTDVPSASKVSSITSSASVSSSDNAGKWQLFGLLLLVPGLLTSMTHKPTSTSASSAIGCVSASIVGGVSASFAGLDPPAIPTFAQRLLRLSGFRDWIAAVSFLSVKPIIAGASST